MVTIITLIVILIILDVQRPGCAKNIISGNVYLYKNEVAGRDQLVRELGVSSRKGKVFAGMREQ